MGNKKPTQKEILKHIRQLGLTANAVAGEWRIDYRKHDPRYRVGVTKERVTTPLEALETATQMLKVRFVRHNPITVRSKSDRRSGDRREATTPLPVDCEDRRTEERREEPKEDDAVQNDAQ